MSIEIDKVSMLRGTLRWAKLDPKNPGKAYDPGEFEWAFDFIPEDNTVFDQLRALGLDKTIKEDKEGNPYLKFTRKTTKKDGSPMKPIEVVDRMTKAWDWGTHANIGNGSVAKIKMSPETWTFGRKTGVSLRCFGVQIIDLKEYSKGPAFEAEEMAGGEDWTA